MLNQLWDVIVRAMVIVISDREMLAILCVSLFIGALFYLVASERVGTLRARASK
jgi:hypothetical protein